MNRILMTTLSGVLTCGLVSYACGGELLRWKFEKGQQFAVTVSQRSETTTEVNNKTISMWINMDMEMDWVVDRLDADEMAQLKAKFTRLSVKASLPGNKEIVFDSASPAEPDAAAKDIAASVKPLVGAKFTIQVTPLGEITLVQVTEETLQKFDDISSKELKRFISKETITKALKQSLPIMPAEEVNVDDTWTQTTQTSTPLGLIKQVAEYTYLGLDEKSKLPQIQVNTKLSLTPSGKSKLVNSKSDGSLVFDTAAGHLTRSELQQQLTTESSYRETKITVKTSTELRTNIESR